RSEPAAAAEGRQSGGSDGLLGTSDTAAFVDAAGPDGAAAGAAARLGVGARDGGASPRPIVAGSGLGGVGGRSPPRSPRGGGGSSGGLAGSTKDRSASEAGPSRRDTSGGAVPGVVKNGCSSSSAGGAG